MNTLKRYQVHGMANGVEAKTPKEVIAIAQKQLKQHKNGQFKEYLKRYPKELEFREAKEIIAILGGIVTIFPEIFILCIDMNEPMGHIMSDYLMGEKVFTDKDQLVEFAKKITKRSDYNEKQVEDYFKMTYPDLCFQIDACSKEDESFYEGLIKEALEFGSIPALEAIFNFEDGDGSFFIKTKTLE